MERIEVRGKAFAVTEMSLVTVVLNDLAFVTSHRGHIHSLKNRNTGEIMALVSCSCCSKLKRSDCYDIYDRLWLSMTKEVTPSDYHSDHNNFELSNEGIWIL